MWMIVELIIIEMSPFSKIYLFIEMFFTRLIFSQAVSLIASYLQVPLRYPLRLDASHSYIIDNAPSTELTSSEASSNANINAKHVEFPLFLEGQDTTRAAYVVFLLNKVFISIYFCFVVTLNL